MTTKVALAFIETHMLAGMAAAQDHVSVVPLGGTGRGGSSRLTRRAYFTNGTLDKSDPRP
jgi:hypothetical protein